MLRRCLLALAALLLASLSLAPKALAQLTEAQVIAVCQAQQPNNAGYTVTHTGFTDLQWRVQDPFPGRAPSDVEVELWVSAAVTFDCRANNGSPVFPVLAPVRGEAYLGDTNVCQNGVMTFAFPGASCPFSAASRFQPVPDNTAAGPYSTVSQEEGPNCTIIRPVVLGADGLRHPVIIWGNGTGATPAPYAPIHHHWASHGFVVAAANTTNAGNGLDMLACLDYLFAQAEIASSPYRGTLNLKRIAASGHSQGATGAIVAAGRDARVGLTAPMQPGGPNLIASSIANQPGPMFLMSGTNDAITPPETQQRPIYNGVNQPVFWGNVVGGLHVPTPPGFRLMSTQWFRLYLMNDQTKAPVFHGLGCTLCTDPGWIVNRRGLP